MNDERKETRGVEGLGVVLMLFMTLFASDFAPALVSFTPLPAVLGKLGGAAIPVFALLCGYLVSEFARRSGDLSAFSLKAVFGLYKIYWAVLLVFLPLIIYANRQLRSLIIYEFIYNFLALRFTFNSACRVLLPFALFVLVFPGVKRLFGKPGVFSSPAAQLAALAALNALVFCALPHLPELSLFSTLSETAFYSRLCDFLALLPSFLLGGFFARHDVLSRARHLGGRLAFSLAALLGLVGGLAIYLALGDGSAFFCAGVLVFCCVLLFESKPLRFLVRPFELLGAEAPFVFFIHSFFCAALPTRLITWPRYAVLVYLWLLALGFGAAKLLGLICRRLDAALAAHKARRPECTAPAAYAAEFTKRDTLVMKGAAVSLMICHHLFTFPERLVDVSYISVPFINGMTLAVCLGQFGKICVALFTLLSGYGTYFSLARARDDDAVTLRHIRSLYVSYWKVFFIVVAVTLLISRSIGGSFAIDFIYSFLGLRIVYCSEWWFIVPFAVLIILAPATKRFIDRPSSTFASRFLWIVAANAALYYILNPLMKTPLLAELNDSLFWAFFSSALTLWPAYALGCLFARFDALALVKTHCRENRALWVCAALGALAGLVYIHPFNWLAYDFLNAALFLGCMLVLFASRIGRLVSPVFERLGKESTSMWLIHTLLCYHWCQKLVFAPRYAFLIFLLLLVMSYLAARLIRLFWRAVAAAISRLTPTAKAR